MDGAAASAEAIHHFEATSSIAWTPASYPPSALLFFSLLLFLFFLLHPLPFHRQLLSHLSVLFRLTSVRPYGFSFNFSMNFLPP